MATQFGQNVTLLAPSSVLQAISVLGAVKDDMVLIFNSYSNLLIGVKAIKVLFWEARVHTLVRTDWACPIILV